MTQTKPLNAVSSSLLQALYPRGIDASSLPPAHEWTPVLAIGSNGAPSQLERKFPASDFPETVIPVVKCALMDFDVVYACHISGYASCTGETPLSECCVST